MLLAGPPLTAVGGVAVHSRLLAESLPNVTVFDQWSGADTRVTRHGGRLRMHLGALVRWVRACLSPRFDVVHLQVTHPGMVRDFAYLAIARVIGLPVITHVHSSVFFESGSSPLANRLLRIATRFSSRTIVLSGHQFEALTRPGLPAERVVRLRNPVPHLDEVAVEGGRATQPPGPTQILCVGEICTAKGQAPLADAVGELCRRGRSAELVLIGGWGALAANDRAHLEQAPHVHVRGVVRGPAKTLAYDNADVFALFSETEGQPLSILEAMARGLPVVATDTGEISELIGPVEGNALVPIGDRAALERELDRLIQSPEGRIATGQRNRRRAEIEFSASRHLATIARLHAEATRSVRPRRRAGGI